MNLRNIKNRYKQFIIISSILGLGYVVIQFCWLGWFSYSEMQATARLIEYDKPLPNSFIKIWDKLFPDSRHNGMNTELLQTLLHDNAKAKDCKCHELNYVLLHNSNLKYQNKYPTNTHHWQMGYGLNYFTSPEQCFSFWLNHDIIRDGRYLQSLDELSKITLGKNVRDLNQDEALKLITHRVLTQTQSKDTLIFNRFYAILKTRINQM